MGVKLSIVVVLLPGFVGLFLHFFTVGIDSLRIEVAIFVAESADHLLVYLFDGSCFQEQLEMLNALKNGFSASHETIPEDSRVVGNANFGQQSLGFSLYARYDAFFIQEFFGASPGTLAECECRWR